MNIAIWLTRKLRIEPAEARPVAILFTHYFLVSAAVIAGKSARDAFFLSRYDKSVLPLMYLANAGGVTLAMWLLSKLSARLSARACVTGALCCFSLTLLLLEIHLDGWAIPVLYVWMEIISSVILLQAWMLTGNAFDPRQAKRLFGIIAAGGSIAAWAGGSAISWLAVSHGSSSLITAVASALAVAAVTSYIASSFHVVRPRQRRPAKAAPASWRFTPYLASIAVVIASVSIVSAIVQFRFQVAAVEMYPERDQLVAFFGKFYAWTGAASLAAQLLLFKPLLTRFGVAAGLLLLPISFATGLASILAWPGIWATAFGRFADLSFKFTINNASVELLWLPIPPEVRQAAKPIINGTLKAIVEAATALLMFALVRAAPPWALTAAALFVCSVWLVTIHRIRGQYRESLTAVIEKRQLDTEELMVSASDPLVAAALERSLRSSDEMEQIAALEFIEGFPLQPWERALQQTFRDGSEQVREQILRLAADDRNALPDALILEAINNGGSAAPLAARTAMARRIPEAVDALEAMLISREPRVRASAAAALLQAGGPAADRGRKSLLDLAASHDPSTRAEALHALPPGQTLLSRAQIEQNLGSSSPLVRRAALSALTESLDPAALPAIVHTLTDPRSALQARLALRRFSPSGVASVLKTELRGCKPDRPLVRAILRTMRDYIEYLDEADLLGIASPDDLAIYQEWTQTLLALRRLRPLSPVALAEASRHLEAVTRNAYTTAAFRSRLYADPDAILLDDLTRQRYHIAVASALELCALNEKDLPVEACLQALRSGDRTRLPYVVELLESSLPREERNLLSPLADPSQREKRLQIFRERFESSSPGFDEQLMRAAHSGDPWERAVAIDYLFRKDLRGLLSAVRWDELHGSRLVKELLARENQETLSHMYTTLEMTIFLKSADLFAGIAAESLSRLAQVAEEVHFSAGQTIFKDGDAGDSLYLVAKGRVRIAKGGKDIALLERGACFGEMAVLDSAPRSADAIASEDLTLLRLVSEDFFDVLSENPSIMQGIIRMLSRRLREVNARLAAAS